MKSNVFLLLALAALASSCGKKLSPFTENVRTKVNLDESQLKRVQFYTSTPIVLRRELGEQESTIAKGEIKIVNGKKIEVITIPERTPGVLTYMPKVDRFGVSFEATSDSYLMFGPNPKFNNTYVLLAREWRNGRGTVSYGGNEYNTEFGDGQAYLLVDLKLIGKTEVNNRTVGGRKIE